MQVAQFPRSHENGGLRPARRAASRMVSPGSYAMVCLRRSSRITIDSVSERSLRRGRVARQLEALDEQLAPERLRRRARPASTTSMYGAGPQT